MAAAHLENEQQATSIAELTASVAAAEAQVAAAAQNAHHPQAGAAQAGDDDTVPKPHGQFSLRQTIGLTRTEMADVRVNRSISDLFYADAPATRQLFTNSLHVSV